MTLELTFLGTSSGVPTKERNVAALAIRHGPVWDLYDCGEGTQHRLLHTSLSLAKLRTVFISHLHGDHVLGLFGLLATRAMQPSRSRLTIIGPIGLRKLIDTVASITEPDATSPLDITEVSPEGGVVVDDEREESSRRSRWTIA